jgi:hypothetical protein
LVTFELREYRAELERALAIAPSSQPTGNCWNSG